LSSVDNRYSAVGVLGKEKFGRGVQFVRENLAEIYKIETWANHSEGTIICVGTGVV
jgi:hypothetical protein